MELFFQLLPLYLIGNFHCIGMCGPLVALLGKHPFRYYYFIGRLLGFSCVGALAGYIGELIFLTADQWHFGACVSIFFGIIFCIIALSNLLPHIKVGNTTYFVTKINNWVQNKMAYLIQKPQAGPPFFLGLLTILLPCGQTVVVFSACALFGEGKAGLLNGFLFALITTPGLIGSLHAHKLMTRFKKAYKPSLAIAAFIVGILSILRGCADIGFINHLVISSQWHIVLF